MSGFWKKYKNKYRLTIFNDTTFEEVFWVRLSRINTISILGVTAIFFFALVFVLIAYTPLKEFIPGYPDGKTHSNIVKNVYRLDSLEYNARLNQQYIDNIKAILEGKTPKNYMTQLDSNAHKISKDSISLDIQKNDSLFRLRIENKNEFDILTSTVAQIDDALVFYPPIKGIVTNSYNPKNKHFGVDVAGESGKNVFACNQGTVILSTWSLETGYVVVIQHPGDIISVYKHLKDVTVKQGERVTMGKQLGKIGDVGTLSTGSHLHFELWRNGRSICPDDFIKF